MTLGEREGGGNERTRSFHRVAWVSPFIPYSDDNDDNDDDYTQAVSSLSFLGLELSRACFR